MQRLGRVLAPSVVALAATSLTVAACAGGGGSSTATPTPAQVASTRAATATLRASATAGPTETPLVTATVASAAPPTPTAPAAPALVPTPTPAAGPAPTQVPPPQPTAPPPPVAGQTLSEIAKGTKFLTTSFTAAAGSPVTIHLDNQDAGVQHNIAVFDPDGAQVAGTDVVAGPIMQQTSFTPTKPGRYTFKCTVHPQQMYGVIIVQ